MLNQNHIAAIVDTIEASVMLFINQRDSVQDAIDALESIRTEAGFLAYLPGKSIELKRSLANLHSFYVGQFVRITDAGNAVIDEIDIGQNRVPLNLHHIGDNFTKDDIAEIGEQLIDLSLNQLNQNVNQINVPLHGVPDPVAVQAAQNPAPQQGAPNFIPAQAPQNQNPQQQQSWEEYIFEEIGEGVKDGVKGFVMPFIHPVQFLENTGNAILHPIDTAGGIIDHAVNHPIRFGTSMATSYGIGKGISYGIDKATSSSMPNKTSSGSSGGSGPTPLASKGNMVNPPNPYQEKLAKMFNAMKTEQESDHVCCSCPVPPQNPFTPLANSAQVTPLYGTLLSKAQKSHDRDANALNKKQLQSTMHEALVSKANGHFAKKQLNESLRRFKID